MTLGGAKCSYGFDGVTIEASELFQKGGGLDNAQWKAPEGLRMGASGSPWRS